MKISIFGMGYVGVVSAACFLRDGHEVIGVDVNKDKISALARGNTPIHEPYVQEMLSSGYRNNRLKATTDTKIGVDDADIILICVGTPSRFDGGIDLSHIKNCTDGIGEALSQTNSRPTIVLRSTVLPGTTEKVMIPLLEKKSKLKVSKDLHVIFHPEFLREGTAVQDFDEPPKIVLGEALPGAGRILMKLYEEKYDAPIFRLSLAEAEMVKYWDNIFHAVKITFANEMGAICRSVGVDSRKVADVFCADKKLNISSKYLRPGFAFGGSCLPKDIKAMERHAALKALELPMLRGIITSNETQISDFCARVLASKPKSVGLIGLAFKPETDDMRQSPYVRVAKILVGEGIKLSIFDPGVDPSQLIGANKEIVQRTLGHLEDLLVPSLEDLNRCETIIINHPIVNAKQVTKWLTSGARVLDVVGILGVTPETRGYEGISW